MMTRRFRRPVTGLADFGLCSVAAAIAQLAIGVATVFGFVLGATTGPAAAETALSVQTPAGTLYLPGRPVPVVVTISADQLVRGEVVVRGADGPTSVRRPVEVPGGSTKRVVLVVDVPPWSSGPMVTFNVDGEVVARGAALTVVRDEEPVGVFPSLARADLPESVPLSVNVGRAMLFPFDPALLAEGPEVLATFTHLAATAADLRALDDAGTDAVWDWVEQGGRLVLDEAEAPTGLPPALELSDSRGALGRGEVVLTAGSLAAGRYDDAFRPTPLTSMHELPWASVWAPTLPLLAADAGIRTPRVTGLLVVIAGYIVVVGPVLWFVLRRRGRELAIWLAVPAAAAATTAVVWVAGLRLRADVTAAHATLVVASASGSTGVSDVLVASPGGGRVGVRLPDRWRAASLQADQFAGGSGLVEPTVEGDRLGVRVDAGSFGVFRATGPLAGATAWEITAVADDDGVRGEVTNRSGHDLGDVIVFGGAAHHEIGAVADGETVRFHLDRLAASLPLEPSLNHTLTEPGPMPATRSVAAGAFSRWLTEQGQAPFTPGAVSVVGWTRQLPAPLTTASGASITSGRTGFVGRSLVEASGAEVAPAAVRSEVVRGPASTASLGAGRHGFVEFTLTMAHTLPAGAGAQGLALEVHDRVGVVEVWFDGRWHAVDLPPQGAAVVHLPAAAVDDGVVHTRFGTGGDIWGHREFPHPLIRSVQPGEEPLPAPGAGVAVGGAEPGGDGDV